MFDQRILCQLSDGLERNIAGRRIEVIDARQDQLHRTALGADDKIDALSHRG
jgi:hypothetical protein